MSYPFQQPIYPAPYQMYNQYPQNSFQGQNYQGQNYQGQNAQMNPQLASVQQAQTLPQTLPMQNGGFAFVKNEQEARDYPVAPGNYMTFKDEHAPYMYEKSKSFSQLDEPTFEKYRLIREDCASQAPQEAPLAAEEPQRDDSLIEALRADHDALCAEVGGLRKEIESLRRQMREPDRKNRRKGDLTHE